MKGQLVDTCNHTVFAPIFSSLFRSFFFFLFFFSFEPRHGVAASKGELAFRDPTASLSFPSFVQDQLAVGNQRRRLALIRGVCSIMDLRRLFYNDWMELGEI